MFITKRYIVAVWQKSKLVFTNGCIYYLIRSVATEETKRNDGVAAIRCLITTCPDIMSKMERNSIRIGASVIEFEDRLFLRSHFAMVVVIVKEMDSIYFADNAPNGIVICPQRLYHCPECVTLGFKVRTDKVLFVPFHINGIELIRIA